MWQFDNAAMRQLTLREALGIGLWALGIAGLRRTSRSDCRAAMPNPSHCPMPNAQCL
jgi:hypothetical protein